MKKIILSILLLSAISAHSQDVVYIDTPGKQLQKFSTEYYTGTAMMAIGGVVMYGGFQEGNDNLLIGAGAGILAGFIIQIAAFRHIGKAGRYMDEIEQEQTVKIKPSRSGIGLALRF